MMLTQDPHEQDGGMDTGYRGERDRCIKKNFLFPVSGISIHVYCLALTVFGIVMAVNNSAIAVGYPAF
jgi:hypothetical protein